MKFILRRLYRDRRRYVIVWSMLFAFGFTLYWGVESEYFGNWMSIVGGLAMMIGIGVFAPLLSLLLPRYRFAEEGGVFPLLLFSSASLVFPSLNFGQILSQSNWMPLFYFMIASTLVQWFFYGGWSDNFLTVKQAPIKTAGRTRISAQRLWDGFCTAPGKEHLSFNENLVSLEYLNEGEPHLRVVETMPPGALYEEIQTVKALEPGKYVSFDFEGVHGKGMDGTVGSAEFRVDDLGKSRRISSTFDIPNRPFRRVLADWIDDTHGRTLDDQLAKLEKKVRAEDTIG